MPPGAALVLVTSVIAGCWMVASIVKHIFGGNKKSDASPSDPELTTSELEALVRRAVEEATAPLHDHIERLEHRLDEPSDGEVMRFEERDYGLLDEAPEELADAGDTQVHQQQRT